MYSIVKLPKILSKSLLSNADEYLFIMKSDSKIINIDSYGNIHKFKTLEILQLNVKKILFLYIDNAHKFKWLLKHLKYYS